MAGFRFGGILAKRNWKQEPSWCLPNLPAANRYYAYDSNAAIAAALWRLPRCGSQPCICSVLPQMPPICSARWSSPSAVNGFSLPSSSRARLVPEAERLVRTCH